MSLMCHEDADKEKIQDCQIKYQNLVDDLLQKRKEEKILNELLMKLPETTTNVELS
jgi:hypothetical protein